MDNKTALFFAIVIIGIFAADIFYFEWDLAQFIFRKLTQFTDWIAVWRELF